MYKTHIACMSCVVLLCNSFLPNFCRFWCCLDLWKYPQERTNLGRQHTKHKNFRPNSYRIRCAGNIVRKSSWAACCGFTPVFTSASALNMNFFLIVVALATPTKANITTTRLTDFIVCSFPQILFGCLKSYVQFSLGVNM